MGVAKKCFVVSPIYKPGSPEFEHYRALYETVVRPVLREAGFDVSRADDIAKSGAITNDIIRLLATADLVIADLSDLNPNVFYELGVRHALRGRGTVMIVDTTKTDVPFDLKSYRFIEFSPDLRGVERLRQGLMRFANSVNVKDDRAVRDNPVHDSLTSLPEDVYANAEGSTEGALREQLAELRTRLARYSDLYGIDDSEPVQARALDIVAGVLAQAQKGELPINLLSRARSAARNSQHEEFLSAVKQLLEARGSVLSADEWGYLATDSRSLGLPEDVELVLREKAIEQNPNDIGRKRSYYTALAHSEDSRNRERARQELGSMLGLRWAKGTVDVSGVEEDVLWSAGVLLDTFNADKLYEEALTITTALLARFPNSTVTLRNHARALASLGRTDEARETYEKGMTAADVSDTTASWYGGFLARLGDGTAALSVLVRACELDPDDSFNFLRVAEVLRILIEDRYKSNSRPRGQLSVDDVKKVLAAVFGCPTVTSSVQARAREVCEKLSIDEFFQELSSPKTSKSGAGSRQILDVASRLRAVRAIREAIGDSSLSDGSQSGHVEAEGGGPGQEIVGTTP